MNESNKQLQEATPEELKSVVYFSLSALCIILLLVAITTVAVIAIFMN